MVKGSGSSFSQLFAMSNFVLVFLGFWDLALCPNKHKVWKTGSTFVIKLEGGKRTSFKFQFILIMISTFPGQKQNFCANCISYSMAQ
jgi:hypothetical protein